MGSNANNGTKASLGNFNSNNGVSNANANISFRTYCECGLIILTFCFYSLGVEEDGDFAPWQKMT